MGVLYPVKRLLTCSALQTPFKTKASELWQEHPASPQKWVWRLRLMRCPFQYYGSASCAHLPQTPKSGFISSVISFREGCPEALIGHSPRLCIAFSNLQILLDRVFPTPMTKTTRRGYTRLRLSALLCLPYPNSIIIQLKWIPVKFYRPHLCNTSLHGWLQDEWWRLGICLFSSLPTCPPVAFSYFHFNSWVGAHFIIAFQDVIPRPQHIWCIFELPHCFPGSKESFVVRIFWYYLFILYRLRL